MIKVCTLSSSSKGNCTFISNNNTSVLVDFGLSFTLTKKALAELNFDIANIDAILITHEHIDHIKGLCTLMKRCPCKIYAPKEIQYAITKKLCYEFEFEDIKNYENGFMINDLQVVPFRVPHDSTYAVAYSIYYKDKKISVATDFGKVNNAIIENLKNTNIAVLEANHDIKMLNDGSYPLMLKRRISGPNGHLSNDDSASLICKLLESNLQKIILAHLSEENNIPELAYSAVFKAVQKSGKIIGKDVFIDVAKPKGISEVFEV